MTAGKLVVFGGTAEGRVLAQRLSRTRPVWVSVATGYGRELLEGEENKNLYVRAGRLDRAGMAEFLREEGFLAAVDATHPYAREVSRALRDVCGELGIPCLRLLREETPLPGCIPADSPEEAAGICGKLPGNILLATGAKELAAFCGDAGVRERLYPRVLPLADSVERCRELGIPAARIIALQGPFDRELNLALMRRFAIRVLVTKDGGTAGGMEGKLAAARELGVRTVVIRRPPEAGEHYTMDELLKLLEGEVPK